MSGGAYVCSNHDYIYLDANTVSGKTDAITSGQSATRTVLVPGTTELETEPWASIGTAIRQISLAFSCPIFVEFAVVENDSVCVFQVRLDPAINRTTLSAKIKQDVITESVHAAIQCVEECGPLSVMTDWGFEDMPPFFSMIGYSSLPMRPPEV